jgi:Tol biopolymer transport system component
MALTDTTPTLVYATSDAWGPAAFSADGKQLLLTIYDGTQWNISSINLDGTALSQLTTSTTTSNVSPLAYKNLIFFTQSNNADSSYDIYVMDQTGGNQTLVSDTASTWQLLNDDYWGD